MILMTWAGFEFFVNPGSIRSFSDLRIETSSTFEDKEFNGLSYKEWKNADPYKVSCKAVLDIKLCATWRGGERAAARCFTTASRFCTTTGHFN